MDNYHLLAVITFASNGDRNRARNAINNYIANWNAAHPDMAWVGAVSDASIGGVRALNGSWFYTGTDPAGMQEALKTIHQDIDANAYIDIVQLTTWVD